MVMVANFCYDNSFDTADLNDDAVGDQETMMTMISNDGDADEDAVGSTWLVG